MVLGHLLGELWAIQRRDDLTDEEIGRQIGVSGAAICRYRAGERTPATPVVLRIVARYPELLPCLSERGREVAAGR